MPQSLPVTLRYSSSKLERELRAVLFKEPLDEKNTQSLCVQFPFGGTQQPLSESCNTVTIACLISCESVHLHF